MIQLLPETLHFISNTGRATATGPLQAFSFFMEIPPPGCLPTRRESMKRPLRSVLFLAIGLLLSPAITESADFTVFNTLGFQVALDIADLNGENDVITVVADIDVSNTLTYVATGAQTLTIIGSGTSPRVLSGVGNQILFLESIGGAITIQNLMFQNGNSTTNGGAINVFASGGVTIENCYFYNNHSDLFGGGAFIGGSPVNLEGNTFDRNTAGNGGGDAPSRDPAISSWTTITS